MTGPGAAVRAGHGGAAPAPSALPRDISGKRKDGLTETERAFRAALSAADRPVPAGLCDGAGRPAGRRYAVYRNNVAVALREALETGFPAVRALVGAENFARAAALYRQAHPPEDPRMALYGAGFATFLAGLEPLRPMRFLPGLARLEHALRVAYHAADAPPIAGERLARLDGVALAGARLRLAPAAAVLRSDWPVVSLRRLALQGAPRPRPVPETALVVRPGYDPQAHVLHGADADFVAALAAGQPLGAAADAAGEGFDPTRPLTLLLSLGAVTDLIRTEE